jgi:hypothetical protein
MKQILLRSLGLGLLTLLPACAFHQTSVALQPVGPAPQAERVPTSDGALLVYSAHDLFGDPHHITPHSDYAIVSDNGKTAQQVKNHLDRFDVGPQQISLAPGQYTVTAQTAHFGRVTVPVVIEAHQTTKVYLDGYPHPESALAAQTNVVKLPDGQIVGWSAATAQN